MRRCSSRRSACEKQGTTHADTVAAPGAEAATVSGPSPCLQDQYLMLGDNRDNGCRLPLHRFRAAQADHRPCPSACWCRDILDWWQPRWSLLRSCWRYLNAAEHVRLLEDSATHVPGRCCAGAPRHQARRCGWQEAPWAQAYAGSAQAGAARGHGGARPRPTWRGRARSRSGRRPGAQRGAWH